MLFSFSHQKQNVAILRQNARIILDIQMIQRLLTVFLDFHMHTYILF